MLKALSDHWNSVSASAPRPPEQPAFGPGGREYRHEGVVRSRHGWGASAYWIFEPTRPAPLSAPLVVLLHGWAGVYPDGLGRWIEHLVRRGNVVLYPVYQTAWQPPNARMLRKALAAIERALHKAPGRVRWDTDRFATCGYSLGGVLAVQIAASVSGCMLPIPKAIMALHPGRGGPHAFLPEVDLRTIRSETLLLLVAGEDDPAACAEARAVFSAVPQVREKNLVIVRSDRRGTPMLLADHFAPLAPSASFDARVARLQRRRNPRIAQLARDMSRGVNALHYYGYWKLFDALLDAAFFGRNFRYALGNTAEQRFMGRWSDGHPVNELQVALGEHT